MTPLVVPVVVDGWQHECCGGPIEVGGLISWRVQLDAETWPQAALDLPVTVEEVAGDVLQAWRDLGNRVGRDPVLVRHGGLTAYVPDRADVDDARARGALREDRHIDVPLGVPPTVGRVVRVRLVSRVYRSYGQNGRAPLPGTEELLDVDAVLRGCFYEHAPDGVSESRVTTEVLVDLRVDPT